MQPTEEQKNYARSLSWRRNDNGIQILNHNGFGLNPHHPDYDGGGSIINCVGNNNSDSCFFYNLYND